MAEVSELTRPIRSSKMRSSSHRTQDMGEQNERPDLARAPQSAAPYRDLFLRVFGSVAAITATASMRRSADGRRSQQQQDLTIGVLYRAAGLVIARTRRFSGLPVSTANWSPDLFIHLDSHAPWHDLPVKEFYRSDYLNTDRQPMVTVGRTNCGFRFRTPMAPSSGSRTTARVHGAVPHPGDFRRHGRST